MFKMVNKDGSPTVYALACGYILTLGHGVTIRMQHGAFIVRRDHDQTEVHHTLTAARKAGRAMEKTIIVDGKVLEVVKRDDCFARTKDGAVYALCTDGSWHR